MKCFCKWSFCWNCTISCLNHVQFVCLFIDPEIWHRHPNRPMAVLPDIVIEYKSIHTFQGLLRSRPITLFFFYSSDLRCITSKGLSGQRTSERRDGASRLWLQWNAWFMGLWSRTMDVANGEGGGVTEGAPPPALGTGLLWQYGTKADGGHSLSHLRNRLNTT